MKPSMIEAPVETITKSRNPEWMKSFDISSTLSFKDIAKTANLPALSDKSFSQAAISMGDTQAGALSIIVSADKDIYKDPRFEQLSRMDLKKKNTIQFNEATKKIKLASSEVGKSKENIFGEAREVSPKEIKGAQLLSFIKKEIAERAQKLPQHLRGRMKALEKMSIDVSKFKKEGKLNNQQSFAAIADISERAFLIAEGGKPESLKIEERRSKTIDKLFASSVHATRAASRLKVEEQFKDGLISGVMVSEQMDVINGKRKFRKTDDFVSTSNRLSRLGLIAPDDERLKVEPDKVSAVLKEPDPVFEQYEAFSFSKIIDATESKKKLEEKDIKPPEHTAPTTVEQVGLSGQYLAAEISRDNDKAFKKREKEADLKASMKKAKTNKNSFSQAGVMEMSILKAKKKGIDGKIIDPARTSMAVRANKAVNEVRMSVLSRANSKSINKTKKQIQK